jgi:sulfur relay (sulfurtransferase) DsrC/TusE family protein
MFELDADGFRLNPAEWDRDPAEGLASACEVPSGPAEEHGDGFRFIRRC